MKKILIVFLILALILPAAVLANTEDDLLGVWAGISEKEYGELDYVIVSLYEDHTALYEINRISLFKSDNEGFVHNAKWELKSDGVHVVYNDYWKSGDYDNLFELTADHRLAFSFGSGYMILEKLPNRKRKSNIQFVSTWDN